MLSAVIITKDSQDTIEKCLRSIQWIDDIIIVDSGSCDKTIEIASLYTKNIIKNEFIDYASQKNLGIKYAKNEWILSIDADEYLSLDLSKEIQEAIKKNEYDGYLIPFKNFCFGKWLKYGGFFPDYHLRLFKKSKGKFVGDILVHEGVQVTGKIGKLKSPIMHYAYSSMNQYFEKFNLYTSLEAKGKFIKNHPVTGYYLFIKPIINFIKRFIIKLGFLDGIQGFLACACSSIYIFVVHLKMLELYGFQNKKISLIRTIFTRK
jgi:glycosyltransferase involved in cell wall biosynthesis